MRLDKYLKVSRLIKRRTVAAEACDSSRIEVNGKPAKPARDVKEGDVITVTFGEKSLRVVVLDTREHTLKSEAGEMYRVLE